MANRETLRAFQSRLAQRLQQAQSSGPGASWLAVEAGGHKCLLPLKQAGEVFPWTAPQPVPYTAPWFLGVLNLRGEVCGVAELGAFTGGPANPSADGTASREASSQLVSFDDGFELHCALRVDRLAGLRSDDGFASSQPPAADAPAWYGRVYTDAAGECWQEIDLLALSQQPRFLNIGL